MGELFDFQGKVVSHRVVLGELGDLAGWLVGCQNGVGHGDAVGEEEYRGQRSEVRVSFESSRWSNYGAGAF